MNMPISWAMETMTMRIKIGGCCKVRRIQIAAKAIGRWQCGGRRNAHTGGGAKSVDRVGYTEGAGNEGYIPAAA